jgi:hypothetical protein
MQVFHRVGKLWRNLFHKQLVDRDLDDELRSYQDMLADEHARSGMNLPDARRKAAVETGGIEQIKEQVREVRMGFSIDTLSRDVRFAMRMLFKQPTFSLTVVSLLAIGIAGTTTIFSVFNSLYLRPLPFEEPERLVYLDETAPQWNVERGAGSPIPISTPGASVIRHSRASLSFMRRLGKFRMKAGPRLCEEPWRLTICCRY